MSMFKLYLLFTLLPGVGNIFAILSILSIVFFVCALFDESGKKENEKEWSRNVWHWLIAFVLSLFFYNIIPSQRLAIKMFVANYVTTNNQIKQLPKVVVEYLKRGTKEDE